MFLVSNTLTMVFMAYILEVWCRLEPLPDELTSRLSLAKCVAESSDRFFREGDILLVSLPIQEVSVKQASAVLFNNLLFFELFGRSRLSIVIKKTTESRKSEHYQKTIDNYVIQVRNLSELKQNLHVLQGYSSWNPHAKFIIVSVSFYESNTGAAAAVIQQLWEVKVVNGIVLLPNHQNTSIFEVYSWSPFTQGHCGNGFDELIVIDSCSYGKFDIGRDWFPNKIPYDLNGCPVRVITVVWPPYVLPPKGNVPGSKNKYEFKDGLEILLMNTMAEMANFSVIYMVSDVLQDWGSIYSNGTATGALLYLKNEEADVAISSFAASVETHMHLDSITYPIPESLKWCVPHAMHIPLWQNLLIVISADTLALVIIIYIIVSFCLWRLGLFESEESTSYKNLGDCSQNALAVMVNSAATVQPRSTTVRSLFMMWIFFSLHLDVGYQTSLTSVFTKPKFEPQIENVNEIFEKKLKLWFLSTTKRYFLNNDDWLSERVLSNWGDCADIRECLYKTAFDRDSATCTPEHFKAFINNRYVTKNWEPLLYCFKNNIVTYPLEMLLRKGYPLRNCFAVLIGRIVSSGLVTHWEKRILYDQLKDSSETTQMDGHSRKFEITISHLYLLFAQLVLGYTVGFITLLLEICIYKRSNCHVIVTSPI